MHTGIFNELNGLIGRLKDLEQNKVSVRETLQQLQHTQKQQQEQLQHIQQQLEEKFQQRLKEKPKPRRISLSEEGDESFGADYQNVIIGQTSDSIKKNTEYLEKLSVSQVIYFSRSQLCVCSDVTDRGVR